MPPVKENARGFPLKPTETTYEWDVKQAHETNETPVSSNNETVVSNSVKQESETTQNIVDQCFTPVSNNNETVVSNSVKQESETTELSVLKQLKQTPQTVVKQVETINLMEVDDRYLKQKCRQAYIRMNTQTDPTTPGRNYQTFKTILELRGFSVEHNPKKGEPWNLEIELKK